MGCGELKWGENVNRKFKLSFLIGEGVAHFPCHLGGLGGEI